MTISVSGTNWSNDSSGTLSASGGGALSTSGTWNSSGTISANDGIVNLTGTFSNTGTISAEDNGTLNLTRANEENRALKDLCSLG